MPTLYPRPSRWLIWLPILTVGVLAFVSAIAVAIEMKTRKAWLWAAGILGLDVIAFVASPGVEESGGNSFGETVTFLCAVAAMGAAPYFAVSSAREYAARRRTEELREAMANAARSGNDAAIAHALTARERRVEAARLADQDPQLARELGIGRPDLPRQYDDGGLVDINHVPTAVLVEDLGLGQEDAKKLVDAREHVGRFIAFDDLVALAGIDQAVCDRIRDHVVLL